MTSHSLPVEKNYSENVANTVRLLHSVHNELLGQVVNLALSGDLQALQKGINQKVAINMKYEDFATLPDPNIQHVIELIEVLKDKMRVLVSVNQIETAYLY